MEGMTWETWEGEREGKQSRRLLCAAEDLPGVLLLANDFADVILFDRTRIRIT